MPLEAGCDGITSSPASPDRTLTSTQARIGKPSSKALMLIFGVLYARTAPSLFLKSGQKHVYRPI